MSALLRHIADTIRATGPLTFAAFMDLALYHPTLGYYAREPRRSGRGGDFVTSVDVGPLFGELLCRQLEEMWRLIPSRATGSPAETGSVSQLAWGPTPTPVRASRDALTGLPASGRSASPEFQAPSPEFDLVEAGAGDGRLSRDILDAAARDFPDFYDAIRLHLVDASPAARHAQRATLGPHAGKLVASSGTLPRRIRGAILANELLDALPVHVVTNRDGTWRELHVVRAQDGTLRARWIELSDAVRHYLAGTPLPLAEGARAEIGTAAAAWIDAAAGALEHGFLLLIDYGHEASELYSGAHASGTLTAFSGHRAFAGEEAIDFLLRDPGASDITAHVDLTAVRARAEAAGLATIARLDQTYFLLALAGPDLSAFDDASREGLSRRLALKTLMMPGGLGSIQKVMVFGRGVGRPRLRGCALGTRLT